MVATYKVLASAALGHRDQTLGAASWLDGEFENLCFDLRFPIPSSLQWSPSLPLRRLWLGCLV
jgi:hypothetical protein